MKIAHVLWGFTSGGIETMLVDIVAEQVKSEEVAIFVINDKIEQTLIDRIDPKCKVYLFRRKEGSKNFMSIIKYNIQLWTYNPDIIHFHYIKLVKFTFSNKPKVITIHNAYSNSSDFKLYNKIYAISDAVREYIRTTGFDSITVENGIRIKDVLPREYQSCNGRKKRFVQVGRLYHPHKGQHLTIEALNILVHEKEYTDFTFDFIGGGESEQYLRELVDKYGLKDYVNFLGSHSRDYIYAHLKYYDVCIQPSLSEGFGLTVAEAMAAKVPVIVSDIPGTMEVIDNGKYGSFFTSEDPQALANKIIEVVNNVDNLYSVLNDAWQYAFEHYDVSMTAKKYMDEYKQLINV